MLNYIYENAGSLLTGIVVLAIVSLIIFKIISDKKKGKIIGCDCGCSSCSKTSCEK